MLERLKRLSDTYGVSGHEGRVRAIIKEEIGAFVDEMRVDAMGNLIAHRRGDGMRVLLSAHMDEVGMLVRGVTEEGLLAISCRSIDPRVMVSKRVVVGRDDVPGVIGAKAIHQQTAEERKRALTYDQLYVDIGAKDKADALKYIKLGDPIAFTTRFTLFGDGLMMGKALDDRIGCAEVCELLRRGAGAGFDLWAAFTVQEECGLRGARAMANAVQPDICLNFEGTTANDVPEARGHELVTRVGGGAALTVMDSGTIVRPEMLSALISAADGAGAGYQLRKGNAGGTDMGAITLAAAGCAAGGISVPCRYIHSPCCVASVADMEAAVAIGERFLSDLPQSGLLRKRAAL